MTRWRYAAATDTGLVRDLNEDAVYVDASLAVVADGMGGHAAGEVAAELAIASMRERFHDDSTLEGLHHAVEEANRAVIVDARENPERFGMGTTVIAVGLTHDDSGAIFPTLVNVGDSRAYQLRDGALRQLSEDHSVAEEWVRMGRLTPEEALTHPRRHQLTRALGVEDDVDVDVQTIAAVAGDRILLCSDGLSNELSVDDLARLASAAEPLDAVVERLVNAARNAGGRDNISAILLEFDEVEVAPNPVKMTVGNTPPPVALGTSAIDRRPPRRQAFTWRIVAAFVLLAAVVGGGVLVLHWYAYSSYYLADDAGTIAVFQGQPNGVLWFKPVKATDTRYSSAHLRGADALALAQTISEPTLEAALNYAQYIFNLGRTSSTTTTTTPHTTTTVHSVTTTKPKG